MRYLYGVLLFCLIALGAVSWQQFSISAAAQLTPYFGRQVIVVADVEPLSVHQSEKTVSAVVHVRKIEVEGENIDYNGRLRVNVAEGKLPDAGKVVLKGTLVKLTSFRNPGGFDGETYNRVNNLGARLAQSQVIAIDAGVSWWQRMELTNKYLCKRMEKAVGSDAGSVLSGMVLGGSSKLDDELREIFTANGIAHLLSVSGTHLVFLTNLLLVLFQPLPKRGRKFLLLLVLVFYAVLCGLRPPVLRALVMSLVFIVGGSGAKRGRLLCLAAVAMLCYRPLWLFDLGFQLSFGAAAGILLLMPVCKKLLPQFLPELLSDALAVTLAAQLAVLPLEAAYFHQFSLVSLISNLLLVPILELCAQLALLGCLFPYGDCLLQAAAFLLTQILQQARWLADLPFSTVTVGKLPLYCVLLYYAVLMVWVDFSWLQFFSNKERRIVIGVCLTLIFSVFIYGKVRIVPLTAYFLDVGQGDCAAVVTPEQKVVVVDTGGLRNFSTGSKIVAPFLRSLGYDKIDILLLSHYDFDHVGGTKDLLRQIQVKTLLLPQEKLTEESSVLQQQILAQAQTNVEKVISVQCGEKFVLDDETQLEIVYVPQLAVSGNEASTLAAVQGNWGSILFTGDLGEMTERQLVLKKQYTVLKAGHHGSRYSTTSEFLAQVQPKLTVLSCGAGNRYGHPHAETLARVCEAGSEVARTDKHGCVKVVFDEEKIKWYSYVYNKKQF